VVPRVSQAEFTPEKQRTALAVLLKAQKGRVSSLLPIKMARMAASPFGYFRGAAPVMARDLAVHPLTGLMVQMCGDAHVRNLGAFAGPDGHLVFDINDFDETIVGPWEWDLKRLATSLVLAGREAGDTERQCNDAVRAFVRTYRQAMDDFAEMGVIDLSRHQVRRLIEKGPVTQVLGRAERSTPVRLLKKLTELDAKSKAHRFFHKPPLLQRVPEEVMVQVLGALDAYRSTLGVERQHMLDEYHPTDVAFKVVGTGSVGTRDYVVLFFGNGLDDPLFIQIKEEPPSCYVPYLPMVPTYLHQGKRVADGQHRVQSVTDPFLGWTRFDGRDYLVRQLSDHKASIEPEELAGAGLLAYAEVCGEIFARAHARTGDAAAIAGYCGDTDKLDRAVVKFVQRYADQTERDHAELVKAIKSGKVRSEVVD
jgi:uncharacterized protein (DUF2252 family)